MFPNIIGPEDRMLLQQLKASQNEFLLAAYDVFKSDKDQENLLDTLLRIIKKYSPKSAEIKPQFPDFFEHETHERSKHQNAKPAHYFSSEEDGMLILNHRHRVHHPINEEDVEFDADKSRSEDSSSSSSSSSSEGSSSSSEEEEELDWQEVLSEKLKNEF